MANSEFIKSIPGIVAIFEIFLDLISISCLTYAGIYNKVYLLLPCTVWMALIISILILIASLVVEEEETELNKKLFGNMYNFVAGALLIILAIYYFVEFGGGWYGPYNYYIPPNKYLMAGSSAALISGVLYVAIGIYTLLKNREA